MVLFLLSHIFSDGDIFLFEILGLETRSRSKGIRIDQPLQDQSVKPLPTLQ